MPLDGFIYFVAGAMACLGLSALVVLVFCLLARFGEWLMS